MSAYYVPLRPELDDKVAARVGNGGVLGETGLAAERLRRRVRDVRLEGPADRSPRATIEPTARMLDAARAAGLTVVYLKMEFARDLSSLGGPDARNRQKHLGFGVGCGDFLIEATWNTDIVPELAAEAGDVLVSKQRYSGFFQTELDSDLARTNHEASLLVIEGLFGSVAHSEALLQALA